MPNRVAAACGFPFWELNLDIQIYFLKLLLKLRQVQDFRSMISAFPQELSKHVLIVTDSTRSSWSTERVDDMIALPAGVKKVPFSKYQEHILGNRNLPQIRILNISRVQERLGSTIMMRHACEISCFFERFIHNGHTSAVIVSQGTPLAVQSLLVNTCIRRKCPLMFVGLSEREAEYYSDNYSTTFRISGPALLYLTERAERSDHDETAAGYAAWLYSWTIKFLSSPASFYGTPPQPLTLSNALTVEITDCFQMRDALKLSRCTKNIHVQLQSGCCHAETPRTNVSHEDLLACFNPSLKLSIPSERALETLDVIYSGCKFPYIRLDGPREPPSHRLYSWGKRLLRITNTDFSEEAPKMPVSYTPAEGQIGDCRDSSRSSTHEHDEQWSCDGLPIMDFTVYFDIFELNGLSDRELMHLTDFSQARQMHWKRPYNSQPYISSIHIPEFEYAHSFNCPYLKWLSLSSVLRSDDPIKVRFDAPNLLVLDLFALDGSDTITWDIPALLNYSQFHGLTSLTLQSSSDEEMVVPKDQMKKFRGSLEILRFRGYQCPWICKPCYNESQEILFPKLTHLELDITHIRFIRKDMLLFDLDYQLPKLRYLYLCARLSYSTRFLGSDQNGVSIVIYTNEHCRVAITSSIRTRSVVVNDITMAFSEGGFYGEPVYLKQSERIQNSNTDAVEVEMTTTPRYGPCRFGGALRYW